MTLPSNCLLVGYLNLVTIFLLVWLIISLYNRFKTKEIVNHSHNQNKLNYPDLLPDNPIKNINDDILDFAKDAKELISRLDSIPIDEPWSIGIFSPWGTGKTSYLNILEQSFDESKYIIIKFNPRHSKNYQTIQDDFFSLLLSKISKYNSDFSRLFDNYIEIIGTVNKKLNIISSIWKLSKKDNKEGIKVRINNALMLLPKRIIIFIDDFDRLFTDEIIEVFKLIDGNAAFNNLIFISAYDKAQINKMLDNKFGVNNQSFSDKFFTLEITVPIRPYEKIYQYLETKILDIVPKNNKEEEKIYKEILLKHIELLRGYLPSLREIKRFINLFSKDYIPIKEEVDFEDYFLLTLIKYKYPSEHRALYIEKAALSFDFTKYKVKDVKENIPASYDILKLLFPIDATLKDNYYRAIRYTNAFDIYFNNAVYSVLSIKEMSYLLDHETEDLIVNHTIEEWKDKEQGYDFVEFILSRNILTFSSKKEFERYIYITLELSKYYNQSVYILILRLITETNIEQINQVYVYKDNDYKNVMLQLFKDKIYFQIIQHLLINILQSEIDSLIFSKEELLNINKHFLTEYLKTDDSKKSSEYLSYLYACIDNISPDTKSIELDKDACKEVCEHIENNKKTYIVSFVRLGMTSSHADWNCIACEPFYDQIFANKNKFESFINNLDEKDNYNLRVKNFWELYKNNEYNPIEFQNQGDVQKKIDNNLIPEKEELSKLLEIEIEFTSMKEKTKENLTILLDKISNIELPIRKKGKLIETIKNEKRKL